MKRAYGTYRALSSGPTYELWESQKKKKEWEKSLFAKLLVKNLPNLRKEIDITKKLKKTSNRDKSKENHTETYNQTGKLKIKKHSQKQQDTSNFSFHKILSGFLNRSLQT